MGKKVTQIINENMADIKQRLKEGESKASVSRLYGVDHSVLSRMVRGLPPRTQKTRNAVIEAEYRKPKMYDLAFKGMNNGYC